MFSYVLFVNSTIIENNFFFFLTDVNVYTIIFVTKFYTDNDRVGIGSSKNVVENNTKIFDSYPPPPPTTTQQNSPNNIFKYWVGTVLPCIIH